MMEGFSIKQVMSMGGQPIEQFQFDFGFVIPNTTNSWEQVIDAEVGQVMPAEVLSGNLTVDTYFMVKGVVFAKKSYRIYYDEWSEKGKKTSEVFGEHPNKLAYL